MPATKIDHTRRIVGVSTFVAATVMIAAIGWTTFFLLQMLEVIPSDPGQADRSADTTETENIDLSLLGRAIEKLQRKIERPMPNTDDPPNPFVLIPTEITPPSLPPPVEVKEPPVEAEEPPVEVKEPPVEAEEPPIEAEEPPVPPAN